MKTTNALPLALCLAACGTLVPTRAPQSGPDPSNYRAIGTEPFWDLTIGSDMVFTDRGNNVSVAEPTPPVRIGFAGEIYSGRRLNVNVVHAACSDGMSDRNYPDTVTVTVDAHAYRGCGAPASFFARPAG